MKITNETVDVVIAGGAAGIGKATVKKFVDDGATVVFCDVNKSIGNAFAEELGAPHSFHQVDVTDRRGMG